MKTLAGVLLALALSASAPGASFQTFQAADVVLGQPDFTTNAAVPGQANRFVQPGAAVVDPTTGKVFVSDYLNNRVLRFTSAAAAQNGSTPEAVLGQADFSGSLANQGGASPAANTLNRPTDLAVDALGRLWVADSSNNRVLGFFQASQVATNAAADRVFGQSVFTTALSGTAVNAMDRPYGLSVGPNDTLWIADQLNSRTLRFDAITAKGDGAPADGVLGQPNFTTSNADVTVAKMNRPGALHVDSDGRLWVADTSNNRALRFDNAAAKANGANADGVLAQPDFLTATPGLSATKCNQPYGIHVDASGALWLGDLNNSRVLRFRDAAALAPGTAADLVLGQPNFTSSTAGTTTRRLTNVAWIHAGPGESLFVADYGNNRVLRFSPVTPTPTPAPSPTITVAGKTKVITAAAKLVLKGTSTAATRVEVKVGKSGYKRATGTTAWKFKATLKTGKNKILVRAIGTNGVTSPVVKITATRKP